MKELTGGIGCQRTRARARRCWAEAGRRAGRGGNGPRRSVGRKSGLRKRKGRGGRAAAGLQVGLRGCWAAGRGRKKEGGERWVELGWVAFWAGFQVWGFSYFLSLFYFKHHSNYLNSNSNLNSTLTLKQKEKMHQHECNNKF